MKKILIIAFIAFNVSLVFAQTEKFDIMTFTPPKGWAAQNGDNAKVFTKIDKAKNTLGIIMLYPSINSSGDANEDFKYVWKQIVQESFGASDKPETEMSEDGGFKIVNGGEMIKYEGIDAMAMLTVLSGNGKVVSVLTITNEQSYVQATEALIAGMKVDAKEKVEEKNTETIIPSNSAIGKKDILGEWSLSDGSIRSKLWFHVNGHYQRRFSHDLRISDDLYQITTWKGDGTYRLNGDTLTINPMNGKSETYRIQIVFEGENSKGEPQKKLKMLESGLSEVWTYYFVR